MYCTKRKTNEYNEVRYELILARYLKLNWGQI